MDFVTFLWLTFAAFVTLGTFSFLYKDNPFYKFAEHLVVGVSAGYFVVILWYNGLVPNLFNRLADGKAFYLWLDSNQWYYVFPFILGVLMWTRFHKKFSWVSRWPMALYIGISTGIAIPLEMSNRVNKQLAATMADIDWANFFGPGHFDLLYVYSGLSQLIIFVGAISALIYFFFSKAHTGAFGKVADVGIWILMIGFGASFGFTVMARISLFINRIQFFDQQWLQVGFNNTGAPIDDYGAHYQAVTYLFLLGILAYIIYELVNFLKNKDKKTETA